MHPDEEALLQTIYDHPDDDAPRLVYADWLEETGDPARVARAEFIRVQIELERPDLDAPRVAYLRSLEADMIEQYHDAWAGPLMRPGFMWQFRRGMIFRFTHPGVFRTDVGISTFVGNILDNYTRFTLDGAVESILAASPADAIDCFKQVDQWGVMRGHYHLRLFAHGVGIRFHLITPQGSSVDYTGSFDGHAFLVDTHSRLNGHRGREQFRWVDVPTIDSPDSPV